MQLRFSTSSDTRWEWWYQDCFQTIANYSWRSAIKDIFWNKYVLNMKHALEGKVSLTISNVNPISIWKHSLCFSVLPFIKDTFFSQKHPILGGFFILFLRRTYLSFAVIFRGFLLSALPTLYYFQNCCAQIFLKNSYLNLNSLCPFWYASVYLSGKLKCAA